MQLLEVSGAVRPLKWSLGVKWLTLLCTQLLILYGEIIGIYCMSRKEQTNTHYVAGRRNFLLSKTDGSKV